MHSYPIGDTLKFEDKQEVVELMKASVPERYEKKQIKEIKTHRGKFGKKCLLSIYRWCGFFAAFYRDCREALRYTHDGPSRAYLIENKHERPRLCLLDTADFVMLFVGATLKPWRLRTEGYTIL